MLYTSQDGVPLSPEDMNSMSSEQKKQLMALENEISKLYADDGEQEEMESSAEPKQEK